jgi:hypothetical protein
MVVDYEDLFHRFGPTRARCVCLENGTHLT